ncbi:MAG: hypothetical protein KBD17_00130 [Candidatus Pacebacteria bacterium]|nr:hypothetical protein [Candidatus Paceibacterota bacterium]
MNIENFSGSLVEGQNLPKALAPMESPDSYTYSFQPILTKEIFNSLGNPYFLQELVSFGGGLQMMNESAIDASGETVTQTSREINLKVTKRTPRSVVEKVFAAVNSTGKIKISLGAENYS